MATKVIMLALATAFLAVGCVAFPENDHYDGRYDGRGYDYHYDQDHRYNRQRWQYEQHRKRLELERPRQVARHRHSEQQQHQDLKPPRSSISAQRQKPTAQQRK